MERQSHGFLHRVLQAWKLLRLERATLNLPDHILKDIGYRRDQHGRMSRILD